jgi:hypothetical protein
MGYLLEEWSLVLLTFVKYEDKPQMFTCWTFDKEARLALEERKGLHDI